MSRPRLIPAKDSLDVALILLAWLGPLLILGLLAIYYNQLPERIPDHFNAQGTPNSMGSRDSLIAFAILSGGLVFFLQILNRSPWWSNYPVEITDENAERQYHNGQRAIRLTNIVISFTFTYIAYGIIRVALGKTDSLGIAFLPIVLLLIGGIVVYFWRQAKALA